MSMLDQSADLILRSGTNWAERETGNILITLQWSFNSEITCAFGAAAEFHFVVCKGQVVWIENSSLQTSVFPKGMG